VIGCFVVYSASWTRLDDPYAFVTRQVVFAIVACVVMAVVMSVDYEWFKERAAFLYGLTIALLVLLLFMGFAGQGLDRISFDLGPINLQPAELAKFTTLIALCAYLAEERSDEVSYARFVGGLILVGVPGAADHRAARPRLGLGDRRDRDGRAARGRGQTEVHRDDQLPVDRHGHLGVRRRSRERLPGRTAPGVPRPVERRPGLEQAAYQVRNAIRAVGTGGLWGKGWLQGPLTNGRDVPVMWADFPFAAIGSSSGSSVARCCSRSSSSPSCASGGSPRCRATCSGTYLCAGVFTMLPGRSSRTWA
jgi:rod shape determining protein RodA